MGGGQAHPDRLPAIADALSIGRLERHVLICAEPTTAKCAPRDEGAAVWRFLKRRLKELGLSSAPPPWRGSETGGAPPMTAPGEGSVLRTKADCLRVCEQGPIVVVYPEGTWYRNVDEEAMERIIQEHLVAGRPVAELAFARDPLGSGCS